MKDLYASLGVPKSASADEIKKAYRALTKKLHPDKNPGDKAAEERFKDVTTAYDVLSDAERRKNYDEFGDISLTQGFDPERARAYKQSQQRYSHAGAGGASDFGPEFYSGFDDPREATFDDFLSRLFGGGRVRTEGGTAGRRVARKGADIEGEISVGLLDALHGVTVPLRIESEGSESRTLDVKVPQGMQDGAKLRLRGQGGPGTPPGDILLTVRLKPHPRLVREGNDLRMSVPITAFEAYRGGPIDVRTPWGTVTLKIPAGSQNGQVLRLRNHGVRVPGKPGGDLLATLDVRMPPAGDQKLLDALADLQAGQDPRANQGF
ncbi:MAG TPA: DnaJ C-terminal domain-containing protein [Nannocystaceae bacterium]|nr:DnaJ C-terminal domain-containing protein [Nannocystaceae bacterium]